MHNGNINGVALITSFGTITMRIFFEEREKKTKLIMCLSEEKSLEKGKMEWNEIISCFFHSPL